jgi:hypothetical protein
MTRANFVQLACIAALGREDFGESGLSKRGELRPVDKDAIADAIAQAHAFADALARGERGYAPVPWDHEALS